MQHMRALHQCNSCPSNIVQGLGILLQLPKMSNLHLFHYESEPLTHAALDGDVICINVTCPAA